MDIKALAQKAADLPDTPGVYIMKDSEGNEIYIGKAKSLRKRVAHYFAASRPPDPKIDRLVPDINDFDVIHTDSEMDALILEAHLIRDLQPKYNSDLKNREGYPFVEVDWSKDFPAPNIVYRRDPKKKRAVYIGPFTEVAPLRAALKNLQLVFKFCNCKRHIEWNDSSRRWQRPCLNAHIGRCSAPCSGAISRDDYREHIKSLIRLLRGKKGPLLKDLQEKMLTASAALEYEKAAQLRDQIAALQSLDSIGSLEGITEYSAPDLDFTSALEELGRVLEMDYTPATIEGLDISNVSGFESVGSVVCFAMGKRCKEAYRRFKIKTVEKIDDYAMMAEVVRRRYTRLRDEKQPFPDIILIDGGKGHLHCAVEELEKICQPIPRVVALAKEEETLFPEGAAKPLRLPPRHLALRLLQQVRDEAHRFARQYHHLLHKKKTFEKGKTTAKRKPQKT